MLDKLTREQFEPLVGQRFSVTVPEGGTIEFALIDVVELPASRRVGRRPLPDTVRRAPFSIFLTGAPLLPQAMYPIRHDAFGREPLEIFIVPIGQAEGGGYEYEAVFT